MERKGYFSSFSIERCSFEEGCVAAWISLSFWIET